MTLFVCFWKDSPQWAMASSFTRFLDHTQRHTTVGRTPLDEWSARRRDLYLTTHNTQNRQTSCSLWDSNPKSQHARGRRPTPSTARPLGLAIMTPERNKNGILRALYSRRRKNLIRSEED